ncbi:MAG: hypothetical protein MZW92_81290 [Comamonadaceae bacterium]|nr:hypothetical protein [Comamonadaceae bacterium]
MVLQELRPASAAGAARAKARVIFQSTPARQPLPKSPRRLRAADGRPPARREVPGDAVRRRAAAGRPRPTSCIDHIGAALDPALGEAAQAHGRRGAQLPLARAACRTKRRARRIQRAHVLVHASRMEGGAHVVMEAVAQRHAGAGLAHRRQRRHAGRRLRRLFPDGAMPTRWRRCCCAAGTASARRTAIRCCRR